MSNSKTDATGSTELGPLQISEIILRTTRYEELKHWYQQLFGGLQPNVEAEPRKTMISIPEVDRLCFLRIHMAFPYTQVLGIFEVSHKPASRAIGNGLDHMQFREHELENLFRRYEYLRDHGVLPRQTFNHGPSTSFYYADPDGNVVELSASNFEKETDYLAFFKSDAFKKNVEGNPVDADAYIAECRGEVLPA